MGKYNFEWKENDYLTPPILYEMALKHFGIEKFTLDTCCSIKNIPAEYHYINGEIDGLINSWMIFSWCNPPFNEAKKWVYKAFKENLLNGCKVAMLIPVRTETGYWHEYILFNPRVKIEWLRKGYKFLTASDEEMGVFKNALALVYFE